MEPRSWIIPTTILCLFGFLKEMKPSEPFLTPYLNSSFKHIDQKALSDEVYPISTYANFIFLFLVFLLTDFLRYKPLIIIESLSYLATRAILAWGDGIPLMQLMQITYGLASATEIAYYAYIYAMVGVDHYQQVTSYTRAATLFGRGISGVLGQILYSTHTANLLELTYISFGSVSVAVVVSLFLPTVNKRVFIEDSATSVREENSEENNESRNNAPPASFVQSWKLTFGNMYSSFKKSYSVKLLLMWSVWWAFAMCGGLQVENYAMNLWSAILGPGSKHHVYNGAIFASGTILSGIAVWLFSFIKLKWNVIGEILIGLTSVLEAVLLYMMAYTNNIWVAYITYVLWRVSYAFIITVASFQIAIHVKMSGYALIFGWNTFIALALQSLLTFVVTDKKGLDLDERDQFAVYGCYFGMIAIIFLVRPTFLFISYLRRLSQRNRTSAAVPTVEADERQGANEPM